LWVERDHLWGALENTKKNAVPFGKLQEAAHVREMPTKTATVKEKDIYNE